MSASFPPKGAKSAQNKLMPKNQKYVRICPKCGSAKVMGNVLNMAIGVPNFYKCAECCYSGHIFPEVEVEGVKK